MKVANEIAATALAVKCTFIVLCCCYVFVFIFSGASCMVLLLLFSSHFF